MDVERAIRGDELAALRSERGRIIQETIDGLPGECRRMIADCGGVVIGQYSGDAQHSRFDTVCGEAYAWMGDEFCLWIGINGRVRTFALKELLQHELAHIIFYTEMMLELGIYKPSRVEYLDRMASAYYRDRVAEYSPHGSVWRKIYGRLTGRPACSARSYSMPDDRISAALLGSLMPKFMGGGIEACVYGVYLDKPYELQPTLSLCGGVLSELELEAVNAGT